MLKRSILTLVFIIISIVGSAQIQRNFFGFTLGVTTKAQVNSYLKNHQIKYKIDDLGVIHADNVQFAGHNWTEACFDFYNGKLYKVFFGEYTEGDNTMDSMFDSYKSSLDRKYRIYYLEKTSTEYWYSDGKTGLALSYRYYNFGKGLCIMYYDEQMSKAKALEEESEL